MINVIQNLNGHICKDDLDNFLVDLEHYLLTEIFDPACINLTQTELPVALRRGFVAKTISPQSIVKVWRLIQSGHLLLVENDLRLLINQNIDAALKTLGLHTGKPARSLSLYVDSPIKHPKFVKKQDKSSLERNVFEMKRITIVSTFAIKTWAASDAFNFKKNLCESKQEQEFLRAIRQFFPSFFSYANLPLRNFINMEKLSTVLPKDLQKHSWHCRVDVLLCTQDDDPVAGVELDSCWHDSNKASYRDDVKNLLFRFAGIPLVRIRPSHPETIKAEDFYDLLKTEKIHELIRPEYLRGRRGHDGLVPAHSRSTGGVDAGYL